MEETEITNLKMAQLKLVLDQGLIKNQYDVNWISNRIGGLNYKIIETEYLHKHCAEWIGSTVLHLAARAKNLDAFNVLLNHGADFTVKDDNSSTVLHQIVEGLTDKDNLNDPFVDSVFLAHLKNNNFRNPSNDYGLSHFHIACATNNVAAVKKFLQYGVSIDRTVKANSPYWPGFTPLHFAIKYCAFKVADCLSKRGANVDIEDAKGMTPLRLALKRHLELISNADLYESILGKSEIIVLMMLNKSNVRITDDWGLSDFHIVCTAREWQLAESFFLVNLGDVKHTVNGDSPLWAGYTALHFAALCNIDTVKLLMKKGADINAKDAKGVTPFDICLKKYEIEEISIIISLKRIWKNIMLSDGETKLLDFLCAMRDLNQLNKFLKKFNKDIVSICNDSPLWPGCSLLHVAVILFAEKIIRTTEESEQSKLDILKSLCKQNPHMLYSQDVDGNTPLHLAFRINKKSIIDLLISFMNVYPKWNNIVNKEGLSFVQIASAQNAVCLLERMLATAVNVNDAYVGQSSIFPNICRGSTALHFAVVYGSTQVINGLIKFGADVHAKDANGMTPIHLLLLNKESSKVMADILLSTPNLKDSVVNGIGLSHLHVASWCDKVEVVERLLDNGSNVNSVITYQPNAHEESNKLAFLEKYAGYSPLLIACQEGSRQTKDLLIERKADYFIKNKNGKPLLYSLVEESDRTNLEWFTDTLEIRDDIDLHVKAETGMTALHIAYLNLDVLAIVKYFEERVNHNEQIYFNSPILPGFTPLHMSIRTCESNEDSLNEFLIKGLITAGADVTLQNAESETAIHMVYEKYIEYEDEQYYSYVNMLLEAQRDFSINPTNIGGISHFHIACSVCNVKIVEKFLNNADIDVNLPIDYFYKNLPGRSPLHLATGSQVKWCGFAKQLDTVDLLLKHGADVHAENNYGTTPLNDCALSNSLDLFERLVRAGSDVNARGIGGFTPFADYLKSDKLSVEGIKILLRFGCRLNSFNPVFGFGFAGRLVIMLPFEDVQNLFTTLIVNFPQTMENDEFNRTIIHNIVAAERCRRGREVTAKQYVTLIEQISKTGCDIDDQDNSGRTALHMATKFLNFEAISGLLLAGADVNVKDFDGNDDKEKNSDRIEMFNTLAVHVKKLQLCGLDVNKENEDFANAAFQNFGHRTLTDDFFKELRAIKQIEIGCHYLTLGDFLSEYGPVIDYPRMSEIKRNAVSEFFSSDKLPKIREEFPFMSGIILLQYRKAKARSNLVEKAKNALTFFVGFRLPDICSELILRLLKKSELENFIVSANSAEDAE